MNTRLTWSTLSLAIAVLVTAPNNLLAQQADSVPATGLQGGTLQTVGEFQVEAVAQAKGLIFFVYDSGGQVVKSPTASGRVTMRIDDYDKTYEFKLLVLKNQALGVAVDLSKVTERSLHLDVELEGYGAGRLAFHTMAKHTNALSDTMLIGLQKSCPVTGQPLGSMGAPPKVMLGDKPLFVCCAGCTAKLKADAETYLKKYYTAVGKTIAPGVAESTLADAEAIAAQKTCPVMDEELGGMGVPQKVNVQGKAVFICCAGCAKKLTADPDKYLAALKSTGVTPPDFQ